MKDKNNKLRNDLKILSDDLTKRQEKLRVRAIKKPINQKNKEEVLKKELEIIEKQLVSYEREVVNLRGKIKVGSEIEQINEKEDELFKQNQEFNDLKIVARNSTLNLKNTEKQFLKGMSEQDQNTKVNCII